jgi:hypothetical protein
MENTPLFILALIPGLVLALVIDLISIFSGISSVLLLVSALLTNILAYIVLTTIRVLREQCSSSEKLDE